MSDVGLNAELELDTRRALRQIDTLEETLGRATQVRIEADVRQVTSAITAAVANANTTLSITADASDLTGSIDAAVEASDTQLTLFADAADVTGSIDAAVDAADTAITITADTGQAEDGLERVEEKADRAADASNRLKGALTAAAAVAVGRALFEIASAASDLAESTSKAGTVFGDEFGRIEEFAEGAATAVGLSTQQALEATGTFGNLFQALGATQETAADLSPQVVTLAADLASFNNLGVEETLEKLRSGLVGEVEPLRALGVSFNAAEVEAKALELGLADANGEVTEGAKLQARFALIMEQTTLAQGDFTRTSEGLANQQRILTAEFRNAVAQVGQGLLPQFLDLTGAGRDLIPVIAEFAERVLPPLLSIFTSLVPVTGSFLTLATSLAPVIELVASAVDAIPDPLLVMVGAAVAANAAFGNLNVSSFNLAGSIGKAVTSLTTMNPVLLGVVATVGVAAAIFAKNAEEQRRFEEEVRELTTSLRDQDGVLRVTTQGLAGYVEEQSRFNTRNQIDDLDRLGLTYGEVAALSRDGAAGTTEFTRQLIESGEAFVSFSAGGTSVIDNLEELNDGAALSTEQLRELADDGMTYLANGQQVFLGGNRDLITSLEELTAATEAAAEEELIRLAATDDATQAIVEQARADNELSDGTVDVVAALGQATEAIDERRVAEEEAERITAENAARQAELSATSLEAAAAQARIAEAISAVGAVGDPTVTSLSNLALALSQGAASETEMQAAADALGTSVENLQTFVDSFTGSLDQFSEQARSSFGTIGDAIDRADEAAGGFSLVTIRDELQRTIDAAAGFPLNLQFLIDQGLTGLAGIAAQRGPEFTAAVVQAINDGQGDVALEVEALVGQFQTNLGPGGTLDQFLVGSAGPTIATATGEVARLASEAFGPNFNLADPAVQAFLEAQGVIVGEQGPTADAAAGVAEDARQAITNVLGFVPDDFASALGDARTTVQGQAGVISAAASGVGAAGATGFSSGFSPVVGTSQGVVNSLKSVLGEAKAGLQTTASATGYGVGQALGAGIEDGIDSYVGRIAAAARGAIQAAENAARAEARSQSPSLLFAEIGADLAEGVAVGIDAGVAEVRDSSANMIATAATSADQAASTAGGWGTVELRVSVDVSGGVPSEGEARSIGQQVAAATAEALTRRRIAIDAKIGS